MVGGLDRDPALAPAREGTDFDRRFGIHGDAQHVLGGIGSLVDPGYLHEDGVRFRDFFWGCVLAPFVGE